ncbi:unnamed protein product [Urochloa decumbens]|uniref:Uncharacterized protein n=1 Tax=Urochloa decumbens TaxID=240449 RepID=A0ABC9DHE1_9POAL
MASASITFVLNRLADQAVKEAALLRGTRDVAHEVEDVLDEFLRKADLDRLAAGRSRWGRWLKLATTFTTQVAVRHDLRERMDGIKDRLKEISDNVDKYWRKQLRSNASPSAPNPSPSVPGWDEETEVFGFQKECKELEKHLLDTDSGRSVISIVGESGIGKSTLAWKVYDSSNIMKQFDVRAWINVPPQIKENDILYFIYKRLCPEMDEDMPLTTPDVHNALLKYLEDKRYLVMVDGLANFTNWNSILQSLPDNGNGSRVMIITRLEDKEEAAYADPKIKLVKIKNLSKEDSEDLFHRRLRRANKVSGGENLEPDQMEKACNNMYEITKGIPLAVVLLGGLLRTKDTKEWNKVFKQLKSSEEPKRVKRILALCFDDLPSRLKSCFLYFAGMPENLIYNARRIVRLWAAEGFLKPRKGKTIEDIGQSYLKELISRGMIQLVKKDINGGVWLVAIHDRLHAFAQLEAQEASFLEVHDNADVLAPASIRRLYLQNYMQSYIPMDTPFPMLRSILCDFAEERSQNLEATPHSKMLKGSSRNQANNNDLRYHALRSLRASKFLIVIDLRGLRIKKVPHAIGDLIHVRYLGLRSCNIDTLPSSIGHLINLQTLDIKRTKVVKVAQAFWEIPTLRHIAANKLQLPKSVGALNNMQTLTGLVCCDPWGNNMSPLNNMVFLRNLEISGLNENHWKGLADAFKKLESLLYLHLAGKGIPSELFTKFNLRRLQILELFGEVDTSSDKVEEQYTLPNLTRIVLKKTKVDKNFMDKIGELPSLTELVLSDESYVGEKLVFSDSGFNHITNLVMTHLPELLQWEIRPHSIPRIKKITVADCPKMKIKLHCKNEDQGLEGLMADLKEVVVWNMHEEISIEPENKALRDMIKRVTMNTKSDEITSAMQRTGRWRAGMIAGDMYHN